MSATESDFDRINRMTRDLAAGKVPPEMAAHMPAKGKPAAVPTVYRHTIKVEYFRQFPFWERIKILFGYNLIVLTGIACKHNPGEIAPLSIGDVTKSKTASDHMEQVVRNMFAEQMPEDPIVHEPEKK